MVWEAPDTLHPGAVVIGIIIQHGDLIYPFLVDLFSTSSTVATTSTDIIPVVTNYWEVPKYRQLLYDIKYPSAQYRLAQGIHLQQHEFRIVQFYYSYDVALLINKTGHLPHALQVIHDEQTNLFQQATIKDELAQLCDLTQYPDDMMPAANRVKVMSLRKTLATLVEDERVVRAGYVDIVTYLTSVEGPEMREDLSNTPGEQIHFIDSHTNYKSKRFPGEEPYERWKAMFRR